MVERDRCVTPAPVGLRVRRSSMRRWLVVLAALGLLACSSESSEKPNAPDDDHFDNADGGAGNMRMRVDADDDDDQVPASKDNCDDAANPDQLDGDHDTIGDAC